MMKLHRPLLSPTPSELTNRYINRINKWIYKCILQFTKNKKSAIAVILEAVAQTLPKYFLTLTTNPKRY